MLSILNIKTAAILVVTGIFFSGCFLRSSGKSPNVRSHAQKIDAPAPIDVPAVSLEQAGLIRRLGPAPANQESGGGAP